MKLYLVKRIDKVPKNEYRQYLCAAETEEEARMMYENINSYSNINGTGWTRNLNLVEVYELVGNSSPINTYNSGIITVDVNR